MALRMFADTARQVAPAVLLALAGAAPALGAAAGPAAAATLIQSCPATIIAPGTYVLARDLVCPAPAITIEADDVRLDLGGRTLTGAGGGDGPLTPGGGVLARGTEANPTIEGLRIANGTLRNFGDGLSIDNAPGVRVAGVTATGGFDGFDIEDSPGARITGNTLTGNDTGMTVLDCFGESGPCGGGVVAGNRAEGNRFTGIEVRSSRVRVEGNRATGNGGDGIRLAGQGFVFDNLIRGNTATGNGGSGILVPRRSTGNRLEGNRATGNGTGESGGFDLEDENLDLDPPVCVNTWRGNRFVTDNEGDGPGAGCIR